MAQQRNILNFANMSPFETEYVLKEVFACLNVSGKHHGRVFGGFVRNVIVPRMKDPNCPVKFKDVDLWFRTRDAADAFVAEMGASFREATGFAIAPGNPIYKFSRKQYHLIKDGICVAWIDVIVSDTLPVNDFNVNELTVCYCNGTACIEDPTRTLIDAIQAKRARMLPEYVQILKSNNYGLAQAHRSRFYRIYLSQGWTIDCPPEILTDPKINWSLLHPTTAPAANNNPTPQPNNNPTSQPNNLAKQEALAAFNMGVEAMRIAFIKLLETK